MIINYKKLRAALEDYSVFKAIKDATGLPANLTVSTGSLLNDKDIIDAVWLEPGAYLAIRLDTVEDVDKLAQLINPPDRTLRQRVLAVAAEVAEVAEQEGIDKELAEYYAATAGAVSASLDYAATLEEAEVLQDEIERLQARQRALAVGVHLRNKRGE
nr:MAG TPA: hypothetical protein [Caudoviricetes sp.]